MAAGLPQVPSRAANRFAVQAGPQGAWICGLVLADDNPLFQDDNANGIDDEFELTKRGSLLARTAGKTERKAAAEEAKEHAARRQPKTWAVRRPLPDHIPAIEPAEPESGSK